MYPGYMLVHGMHSEAVRTVQRRLQVNADGIFGPQTEAAVKNFQKKHGLGVDGVVGPRTWAAMFPQSSRPLPGPKNSPAPKAGSMQERAYRVAVGLLGVTESWGENMGPKVNQIIKANGGTPGEAWCGDTMAYCYRLAGSHAVNRSWASVRLLRGLAGVRATSHPVRGDLVRYTFDHVEMFVADHGGTIETIGGNTGPGLGGVYRRTRAEGLVRDYLHVTR